MRYFKSEGPSFRSTKLSEELYPFTITNWIFCLLHLSEIFVTDLASPDVEEVIDEEYVTDANRDKDRETLHAVAAEKAFPMIGVLESGTNS